MRLRHRPWAEDTISANREVALGREDEEALPAFDRLEIGSGRGRFLLEKALKEPDHTFLGLEMNYNAFALAVKRWAEMDPRPANAKFLNDTLEHVIDRIPAGSVEEIYLNFSDPWPKVKQQKRRLTHPDRLAEYYRILKLDGRILFKTDNRDLFEASIHYFEVFGRFTVTFQGVYEADEPSDVCTEFEQKFREQGLPIYRIVAVKRTDEPLNIDPRRRLGYVPELALYQRGKVDRLTEATFRLKGRLQVEGPFEDGNISLVNAGDEPVIVCGTDLLKTAVEDFHPEPAPVAISALKDGDVVEKGETLVTIDGVAPTSNLGTTLCGLLSREVRVATLTRKLVERFGSQGVLLLPIGEELDRELASFAFQRGGGRLISSKVGARFVLSKPVELMTVSGVLQEVASHEESKKPISRRDVYIKVNPEARELADLIGALKRPHLGLRPLAVVLDGEDAQGLMMVKDMLDSAGFSALPLGLILPEKDCLKALDSHPLAQAVCVVVEPDDEGPIRVA